MLDLTFAASNKTGFFPYIHLLFINSLTESVYFYQINLQLTVAHIHSVWSSLHESNN